MTDLLFTATRVGRLDLAPPPRDRAGYPEPRRARRGDREARSPAASLGLPTSPDSVNDVAETDLGATHDHSGAKLAEEAALPSVYSLLPAKAEMS